jgi:CRP-like cAMP-binding protein
VQTGEANKNLTKFISESGYFQGLPEDICVRLAGVSKPRELAKREVLFHEQARGTAVFLMLSGCVQLHKTAPDGTDRVIRIVRPGEVFAEVILFEEDRYPVTATALARSRILAMDRARIIELLDNRRFRDAFIALLLRRQRYLAERVRYLTSFDVEGRFFRFLKENYGMAERIVLDLPKKDIAASIGATPETLSRLVQKLQAAGHLHMSGKHLRITPEAWARADVS